jgi:hypothetical protein
MYRQFDGRRDNGLIAHFVREERANKANPALVGAVQTNADGELIQPDSSPTVLTVNCLMNV